MDALRRLRAAFDAAQFRESGHDLVDQLADYLDATLSGRMPTVLPACEPDDQLAATPMFGEEPGSMVKEVAEDLLRRGFHLHHPRTMGHQDGLPIPAAALAGFLTSLMNNDPSVYETGPAVVPIEVRVLRWMSDEIGLPQGAGGVITNGGSLGNLTALLAARQARAGFDLWSRGQSSGEDLCLLVSEQAHYCVSRAVRIMGWGDEGIVKVPVDANKRLEVAALPAALEEAKARGRRPIVVVGSACTTATGSYDPLDAIADFAEAHGLWFHVDAAHGGSVVLSPEYRDRAAGLERADSIVWDCHKMMMMPALLTAVLFRDGRSSYETFRQEATYLFEERPDEEWYNPGNRTVECTRPGSAVLLYMALRVHGVGVFRDYVTRCFDVARMLAAKVEAAEDFELHMQPDANIVCFRFRREGAAGDGLHEHARRVILESGRYYLTSVQLDGKNWLRCSLQNPFTDEPEIEGLLETIRTEIRAAEETGAR
ncbi:MAG: pyridoxal-dependent decarboxylase [Deltaproteobacteria bacterium]|nr:pyridoxal-dependent decarboxylase [Deltaproteobacteria bacterium]